MTEEEYEEKMKKLPEKNQKAMRGLSSEERDENIQRGLKTIVNYCERTGKKLFFVET